MWQWRPTLWSFFYPKNFGSSRERRQNLLFLPTCYVAIDFFPASVGKIFEVYDLEVKYFIDNKRRSLPAHADRGFAAYTHQPIRFCKVWVENYKKIRKILKTLWNYLNLAIFLQPSCRLSHSNSLSSQEQISAQSLRIP